LNRSEGKFLPRGLAGLVPHRDGRKGHNLGASSNSRPDVLKEMLFAR